MATPFCKCTSYGHCCEFGVLCDRSQGTRFPLWCGRALNLQRTTTEHCDRRWSRQRCLQCQLWWLLRRAVCKLSSHIFGVHCDCNERSDNVDHAFLRRTCVHDRLRLQLGSLIVLMIEAAVTWKIDIYAYFPAWCFFCGCVSGGVTRHENHLTRWCEVLR